MRPAKFDGFCIGVASLALSSAEGAGGADGSCGAGVGGGFFGAQIREHHQAILCVALRQTGAGPGGRHDRRRVRADDRLGDAAFKGDGAAVAEPPVPVMMVVVDPPRGRKAGAMAGREGDRTMVTGWEEDRAAANAVDATTNGAETAADAANTSNAADAADAAATTEAADTDGMAETAATAEPAGIGSAGGKGGRSNRGSSCESEDEFA